jgi:hypothetical protein
MSAGAAVKMPLTMELNSSNTTSFLLQPLTHPLLSLLQSLSISMLMLLSARPQHPAFSAKFDDLQTFQAHNQSL